jgi:VanZ family protein
MEVSSGKFRLASFVYVGFLTLLLLTPDPAYFLGVRHAPGWPGVHFLAFAVLGFLVAAGRFTHRGVMVGGLLLLCAVGVELLQTFVPSRSVEVVDLLENMLGLAIGAVAWLVVANREVFTGRDTMPNRKRFRVLTPEGLVTHDTFTLADEQPESIKADCMLLVHESSGRTITAHGTRLIPAADPPGNNHDHQQKSVCMNCGHVEGVIEDQVACPHLGDKDCCELVEVKG